MMNEASHSGRQSSEEFWALTPCVYPDVHMYDVNGVPHYAPCLDGMLGERGDMTTYQSAQLSWHESAACRMNEPMCVEDRSLRLVAVGNATAIPRPSVMPRV